MTPSYCPDKHALLAVSKAASVQNGAASRQHRKKAISRKKAAGAAPAERGPGRSRSALCQQVPTEVVTSFGTRQSNRRNTRPKCPSGR